MIIYNFRYDYLGLSTETKPDASKLADGTTYYEVNTGKLWLVYNGTWYDQDFSESEE